MNSPSRTFAGLRVLPAPVRVSALVFFAASLADGVIMPFFALWAVREAGVPVGAVGLLLGLYAGGELLATPLVGGLSDRLGRRPVLIGSTLGVGFGFLILSHAHGWPAAAAALLAIGAFESVLHPTAAAVVADVVPAADLHRNYGLTQLAGKVGGMIGPALGALLAAWSLWVVFVAAGLVLLGAACIVAFRLDETRSAVSADDDDGDLASLGAAFRDRRLSAILVPLAVIEITTSWIEAVLPLAATRSEVLTPQGVGWLFAYAGVLGVAFQMPVLWLSRSLTGSRIALAAGVAFGAGFAALAILPGLPGFILAVTGMAFGGILLNPLAQALVVKLAPVQARATYTAALSAVNDLKDAAGPAIGTALFALTASLPWLSGLCLVSLAAFGLAARLHRRERDPPHAMDGGQGGPTARLGP